MSRHAADEDLLAYADDELEAPLAADLEQHLIQCAACSAKHRALRYASSDAAQLCRSGLALPAPTLGTLRQTIALRMQDNLDRRRAFRTPLVLALTAALVFLTVRYEASLLERSLFTEQGALPISWFTPGMARSMGGEQLCNGTSRAAPAVSPALRLQVLRDYGMEHVPQDQYELDYLITPELGGMTDRRNLWPEPYGLRAWNAHAKDSLEAILPQLVCSGRIDLVTAQREMASNWISAYKKYLESERPVQLHARLLLPSGRQKNQDAPVP